MSVEDMIFEILHRMSMHAISGDSAKLYDTNGLVIEERLYHSYDWLGQLGGDLVESARAMTTALMVANMSWLRVEASPSSWSDLLNGAEGERGKTDMIRMSGLYRVVNTMLPEHVPEVLRATYPASSRFYREDDLQEMIGAGSAMIRDHERTGAIDLLDDAIAVLLFVSLLASDPSPVRGEAMNRLGSAFTRKFECTGDGRLLNAAKDALTKAANQIPQGNPWLYTCLSHLAHAHIRSFDVDGNPEHLTTAIGLLQRAITESPDDHNRAGYYTNLVAALMALYSHRKEIKLLDLAFDTALHAVAASADGDPELSSRLGNLGTILRVWPTCTGDTAAVDRAIGLYRRAIGLTSGPDRWLAMIGLTKALVDKYAGNPDPALLDEAVTTGRAAAAASDPARHEYPFALLVLADALRVRTEHQSDDEDSCVELLDVLQRAERRVPENHPRRADVLALLGECLMNRFMARGDQDDWLAAVKHFDNAALALTAPALDRALAAGWAGVHRANVGDFPAAADAFAEALTMLDLALWGGLSRDDHERLLATAPGVVNDAAACALHAKDPHRAVELLEQGRGILLGRTFDTGVDHETLRRVAPELADLLRKLQGELDAARGLLGQELLANMRRRESLANDRDALIKRIRGLDGCADFLKAPKFAALRAVAADGPVVLINMSKYRSDALIVLPSGLEVVSLPALTVDTVADRVANYLDAVTTLSQAATQDEQLPLLAARATVNDTLAWLWTAIVHPVLMALSLPKRAADWPRLWWCPTSVLSLLPLHAAGCYTATGEPSESALDHIVSSYTPTLRALLHTRARPHPRRTSTPLLLLSMPETPGYPDIPDAEAEAWAIGRRFPDHVLLTGTVTTAEMATALAEHDRAHIICHGVQDIAATSRGGLALHDGVLTVREILAHRSAPGKLAVLSACVTAQTSLHAVNEGTSFAATLQLTSFQHVIGTLTAVGDTAPEFADIFYAALEDTDTVAHALHNAVQTLRKKYSLGPMIWAPYVHFGP